MAEEEQKPIIKKEIPYAPIKYFVSSLNTFFAHHLVSKLSNEHIHPDNPNQIVGTKVTNNMSIPAGVRKVIDTQKVKYFQDVVLNSDVIIYDLNECDLKQAEFVISTLKIHPFPEEKTLICISNVMTWARTSPKEKKEGQQQEGEENPLQQPDSQQQGAPEPAQGQQKKTYVRFSDKDYVLRKSDPEFQKIKSIETLCLAAGNIKPNLKTYVVCSGLLYGQGENLFKNYFMQARLQRPQKLQVYGKGKNRIPTVHIADLITYVEKIVQKKPKLPYLLAIDHNPKPTQKKIIEAISKGIGTGLVESVAIENGLPRIKQLTLNLRMRPSMIFAKIEEEEAAIQAQQGTQPVRFKFVWRSKDGIQKSIQNLRQQFNKINGLQQTKIFVAGPPGCGKTYNAKILSQKYYLPHIDVKNVIQQVKQLKNEFGEEIRAFLAEKKESEIANKQTEYQELKEKLKKLPKEQRQPLPAFDPESVDVRLSEELLYKCFKWRLTQNDCLNRGYILDGYPRKFQDAKEIFMGIPVVEGEQGGDQNTKKVLQVRLVPNKLIILQMSDAQIIERVQKLPEQQLAKTHLQQHKIKGLLKRYRDNNNAENGQFILQDFFKENKISCHHVKVSYQAESILQSLVKPLSRVQTAEREIIQRKLQEEKERKAKAREQLDKKEMIIRNIQNEDYVMKKENEQNEERQILDKKSLALRKYLDVNLVPILSEGIAELLKNFPKDPVDTLAEFLFKNSLKVPNPDPSTFEF